MAAMANAIGNKSLFFSKYDSFKKVKKTEMVYIAMILKQMAEKAKSKSDERKTYLKEAVERHANPLWQYLNMSLALNSWKRYLLIYDSTPKDEVDIDSADFKLEELEEDDKLDSRRQNVAKVHAQIKPGEARKRNSFLMNTSKGDSPPIRPSSKKRSTLIAKNKVMPANMASNTSSKKPTVIENSAGMRTPNLVADMNQEMDNLEKNEILKHKETIQKQIEEDNVKDPYHRMSFN